MKIKQIKLILAALIISVSTGVSLVAVGPISSTAKAYKCVGTPDDYYFEEPGSLGENKAKLGPTATAESLNFHWDDKLGRCVVTVYDGNSGYKSQNDDGSSRPCNKSSEKLAKIDGTWKCYTPKVYTTNDKPVNDDGSPIDPSQRYCGGNQDNYDDESFSCKESGSCNITFSCDYNKVGLNPDPTTNCIGGGGVYDKSKQPTCSFTENSCKAKDLKLKADKTSCEALNDCDKKFGTNATSDEYKACSDALNNPNQDCSNQKNDALKKACEAGQAAAPESFQNCGEAQTVLIKCSDKARGLPVIGAVLKIFITVLSVIVGIGAVGGIAYASILYAKAGDNASNVSEARTLIRNIVIGILLYGFLVAIVNWLIPGGVIG